MSFLVGVIHVMKKRLIGQRKRSQFSLKNAVDALMDVVLLGGQVNAKEFAQLLAHLLLCNRHQVGR